MSKNTSRHLIDEYPIMFHSTLAVALGVNEAILLQKIHMWLQCKPPEVGGEKSFIYNSYKSWQEQLPFFSESTIKRTLTNLTKQGILIKANFNKNPNDRTNWYSIDYDKLDIIVNQSLGNSIDLPSGQNDLIHEVKMTRPSGQNDPSNTNIYNNINNNIYNNILTDKIVEKNVSKTNEYQEEFEKLWKLYPRKEGKRVAEKVYLNLRKKNEVTYEQVEKGILAYIQELKKNRTISKFIMQGSTYFNQRRWEDELPVETKIEKIVTEEEQDFFDRFV